MHGTLRVTGLTSLCGTQYFKELTTLYGIHSTLRDSRYCTGLSSSFTGFTALLRDLQCRTGLAVLYGTNLTGYLSTIWGSQRYFSGLAVLYRNQSNLRDSQYFTGTTRMHDQISTNMISNSRPRSHAAGCRAESANAAKGGGGAG